MTNRGSLSGRRTAICHWSLVIFSGAALGRDGAKHGESARAKGSKTGNASIGAHSEVTPGAFLAGNSGKIFGQQLRLSLPGREILYFACDRRPGSIFHLERRPGSRRKDWFESGCPPPHTEAHTEWKLRQRHPVR